MQRLQPLKCQIRQTPSSVCTLLFLIVILILAVDNLALLAWVLGGVFGSDTSPVKRMDITATPALMGACVPLLSLLPSRGDPGTSTSVLGECWPAHEDVTLVLAPPPGQEGAPITIATLTVGEDGRFGRLVSVPVVGPWPRLPQIVIQAIDASGQHTVSVIYTQTHMPGAAGTMVVITPTPTPESRPPEASATDAPVAPTVIQVPVSTAPPTAVLSPPLSPTPYVPPTNTPGAAMPTPLLPTVTSTPLATATSTATPVPEQGIWRAEFYRSPHLGTQPDVILQHAEIGFNWEKETPVPGVQANNFSVRWTRYEPFKPGNYRFYAFADDGIRVWLDNQELVSEWHAWGSQTYVVDRALGAGTHKLIVEYYEQMGDAFVHFWWEPAGSYANWRGEYYDNQYLMNAPLIVRDDAAVNFDWGDDAPHPDLPADSFSVRWTQIRHYDAGTYQFDIKADDGFRLYIDGKCRKDDWYVGAARDVRVSTDLSEGYHSVVIEYFDANGAATAHAAISRRLDNAGEGQ